METKAKKLTIWALANLQHFDEIAYMCLNDIRISEWFDYLLDKRDFPMIYFI